jgi:hypothetical protein
MATHRKSDRRHVYLCAGEFRKSGEDNSTASGRYSAQSNGESRFKTQRRHCRPALESEFSGKFDFDYHPKSRSRRTAVLILLAAHASFQSRVSYCVSLWPFSAHFAGNKAGAGIEPANSGFADRDLTTWLPRQIARWQLRGTLCKCQC